MSELHPHPAPFTTILLLLLLLTACTQPPSDAAPTPDPTTLTQSLMEADRAFNRATQERGADGWVSFFDAEGAMILEGVGEIRGLDAIRSTMTDAFSPPGVSLAWEPTRAHTSDDGTLGFTVGDYESTSVGASGGPTVAHGLYVSIWRRQPDGSWRVMMDLGNPTD